MIDDEFFSGNQIAHYGSSVVVPPAVIEPDPEPDALNIQRTARTGDEGRDNTIQTLTTAHSRGFLTAEEFGARREVAMRATTRTELNKLVSDLEQASLTTPAPPAPKPNYAPRRTAHALAFTISVLTLILGSSVTYHETEHSWGQFIFMPLVLIIGVAMVVASGTWWGQWEDKRGKS